MPLYDTSKVDNSSTLPASEYNQAGVGHNNFVTSSGQTPVTGGPDQYSQAAAQYAVDGDYYVDSGSTTNAYVAITHTARKGLTVLTAGVQIRFIPLVANTGAATINVNGLGITPVVAEDGVTPLTAGDMAAGVISNLFFDGTNFRLQKPVTTGLPKGFIDDTVDTFTATTVDWYGECRSFDDTTDLSATSGSPLTATLAGAPIDATRYLFIGKDAGNATVAEFGSNADGSDLSTITGAKRRVRIIFTDGSGNIDENKTRLDFDNNNFNGLAEKFAEPIAGGNVDQTGTTSYADGVQSVTKVATGTYDVVLDPVYQGVEFDVLTTQITAGFQFAFNLDYVNASFRVQTYSTSVTVNDRSWMFRVFARRGEI